MVDKTLTNAYYEIDIDPSSQLPVSMKVVILTGTTGGTQKKGNTIVGGRHAVFNFYYTISDFGKVAKPDVPPEAMKLLGRS